MSTVQNAPISPRPGKRFRRDIVKKPKNLNLSPGTAAMTSQIVGKRYGLSLSEFTERLYEAEIEHKRGLLFAFRRGPNPAKA